jgi:hypothetical protein
VILTLTPPPGVKLDDNNLRSLDDDALSFDAVNIILRRVAAQFGCAVAEVSRAMAGAAPGVDLWEQDGRQLSFEGYSCVTRAVVDALGYPELRVPRHYEQFKVPPLPGIIPFWRIRAVGADETREADGTVVPGPVDDTWSGWVLPETNSVVASRGWWRDQQRRQGVALGYPTALGPAGRYVASAQVVMAAAGSRFIDTDDGVQALWLNGVCVRPQGRDGSRPAGGQRIQGTFNEGTNRLDIVAGEHFFVSVTGPDAF